MSLFLPLYFVLFCKASKTKKKSGLDSDVFASAEEFSELLEAAGAARDGSSRAVSNKDKACKENNQCSKCYNSRKLNGY